MFLGLLGLTVLPISAVVGNYISNVFEDRYTLSYTLNLSVHKRGEDRNREERELHWVQIKHILPGFLVALKKSKPQFWYRTTVLKNLKNQTTSHKTACSLQILP
jgi:hypothetical protein